MVVPNILNVDQLNWHSCVLYTAGRRSRRMTLTPENIEVLILFFGAFLIAYVFYKLTLPVSHTTTYPPTLMSVPFFGSLPFMPKANKIHIWFMDKLPTMGSLIGFHARSRQVFQLHCQFIFSACLETIAHTVSAVNGHWRLYSEI